MLQQTVQLRKKMRTRQSLTAATCEPSLKEVKQPYTKADKYFSEASVLLAVQWHLKGSECFSYLYPIRNVKS